MVNKPDDQLQKKDEQINKFNNLPSQHEKYSKPKESLVQDKYSLSKESLVQEKYLSTQEASKPKESSVERNFELRKSAKKVDIKEEETTENVDKIHTLRYSSGGVLSNKSAQTPKDSDLPFIDEDELELDEAIQDATGLAQDQRVQSIQLNSTAPNAGTVQGLLLSQRSCSGTDTIHISEKVIQRDYRDM